MGLISVSEEFRLTHHQTVYNAELFEYISSECGVRVIFVLTERPVLDATFVIPTEPHDNTGCAHALEHLIFFGSNSFPYRGFLDALATRCLAETTNAWTSTDHTAYAITTAGYTGFLNIFPIYLDHIMNPLITESSLLTEVHHINENGFSEGVIYSELEGTEYQCSEVIGREVRRRLYSNKCGYSFDAGGYLNEVVKLDKTKILDFHQTFYRWDNLSIILIGNIPIDIFLKQLSKYLRSINAIKSNLPSPWSQLDFEPPPLLSPSTVFFPTASPQDDLCDVVLAWSGPAWACFRERLVLDVLGNFLCSSFSSPLENAFVNIPYPKCSGTYFSEEAFQNTYYSITFSDVKKKNLNKIKQTFLKVITELCTENLNLAQIQATVSLVLALYEHELEESPEDGFGEPLVEYLVNTCGKPNKSLFHEQWTVEEVLDTHFMKESLDFWKTKLKQYFLDKEPVEVRGVPSFILSKSVENERKKQAKKAKKVILSPQRREAYLRKLDNAKNLKVDIPHEVLSSFDSPSFTDVKTFNIKCCRNFQSPVDVFQPPADASSGDTINDLSSFPFPVNFVSTPSQFLEARLLIRLPINPSSTSNSGSFLSNEEITLLPLFCELLFHCNVATTYMKLSYSDSSKNLLGDQEYANILLQHLVGYRAFLGITGEGPDTTTFPEILTLYFCARKTKMIELGEIFLTTLKGVIFSESCIASLSKASLTRFLRRRRKATTLLRASRTALRYTRHSIRTLAGLLHQQETLRCISNDPKSYVDKFQMLYNKVFYCVQRNLNHSPPFLLHLVGPQQETLSNTTFRQLLAQTVEDTRLPSFTQLTLPQILQLPCQRSQGNSPNATAFFGNGVVMESSNVEGSCLIFSCPGTGYSLDFDPVNLLALSELLSNGDAGPLFNAVRGSGSAYGAMLDVDFVSRELFLQLRNCSDAATAFSVSLNLIQNIIESSSLFTANLIENAKCAVFLRLLRSQTTYTDYALEGLHNLCLGLPANYSSFMTHQLQDVSSATLQRVAEIYFSRFFSLFSDVQQNQDNLLLIVTGTHKAERIREQFLPVFKSNFSLTQDHLLENYPHLVTWDQLVAWAVTGDFSRTDQVQIIEKHLDLEGTDDSDDETIHVSTKHTKKT